MKIKMENGKRHAPKDSDEVKCEVHGVVTTWGALDGIQQLAVAEGIDTVADSECLLLPSRNAAGRAALAAAK
jgi:hypothetical protein